MNHLKKHWPTYAAGAAGLVIGSLTVVGVKTKNFVLGPTAKRLLEK